jgi:hypothetical protein
MYKYLYKSNINGNKFNFDTDKAEKRAKKLNGVCFFFKLTT